MRCVQHPQYEQSQCPACLEMLMEDLVRQQRLRAIKYPWFVLRVSLWGGLQRLAKLLLTDEEKQLVIEEEQRLHDSKAARL